MGKFTAEIYLNDERVALLEKKAKEIEETTVGGAFPLQDMLNSCLSLGVEDAIKKYTKGRTNFNDKAEENSKVICKNEVQRLTPFLEKLSKEDLEYVSKIVLELSS